MRSKSLLLPLRGKQSTDRLLDAEAARPEALPNRVRCIWSSLYAACVWSFIALRDVEDAEADVARELKMLPGIWAAVREGAADAEEEL